jgi:hypothetical protein
MPDDQRLAGREIVIGDYYPDRKLDPMGVDAGMPFVVFELYFEFQDRSIRGNCVTGASISFLTQQILLITGGNVSTRGDCVKTEKLLIGDNVSVGCVH